MIVSDVATRVRREFGDESSVQITDDDIIRWINDAQEQIAINNEGLMETTSQTDVVAGQAVYATPSDMSVLRSLSYQGFHLKSMTFNEFNEYMTGFNAPGTLNPYGQGIPICYMIWQDQITIFPTPSESVTGGLYIYYIKHPVAVIALGSSLSVPLEYHNSVVSYCLKQAYELDEDMYKSALKGQEFEQTTQKLNDRNKWAAQEYYPGVTTLPDDANFGSSFGGWWGGYY